MLRLLFGEKALRDSALAVFRTCRVIGVVVFETEFDIFFQQFAVLFGKVFFEELEESGLRLFRVAAEILESGDEWILAF